MFTWDLKKSASNEAKHGKAFAAALPIWSQAFAPRQLNVNSGEPVMLRVGVIDSKVWGAMYVERGDDEIRILSFRRLNKRERAKYGF